MAITEAEKMRQLAVVRRLEAAGFRAWPASSTGFDDTWAVRVTASFPAKRLNSVNPLDPSDNSDIPSRLQRAAKTFAEHGRSIMVRQSPLAPPDLVAHLDEKGWSRFDESLVMTDLAGLLDVAVHRTERQRGVGRDLVKTALRYTAHKGAKTAWVQVEADNAAGLSLYRSLGFNEAYRYVYRAPPGGGA